MCRRPGGPASSRDNLDDSFRSPVPRLARYVMGVDDDTIMAAVQRLRQLYAEVSRREARLA